MFTHKGSAVIAKLLGEQPQQGDPVRCCRAWGEGAFDDVVDNGRCRRSRVAIDARVTLRPGLLPARRRAVHRGSPLRPLSETRSAPPALPADHAFTDYARLLRALAYHLLLRLHPAHLWSASRTTVARRHENASAVAVGFTLVCART